MKKVLIICDLFPPAFGPRMGYLCKYLSLYGWEAVVLTEAVHEKTFSFLSGKTSVSYINFYTAQSKWGKKLQWFFIFLLDFCFGYKDYKMYKMADKLVLDNDFDLILCSSFRTFPIPAAQKVASKYKLPLIVDLRDIIEQYTGSEFIYHRIPKILGLKKLFTYLFKQRNLHLRNNALVKADHITTISPWHVDVLKQYNPNCTLIYNGYDPELFFPEQLLTSQFIITYTGRILSTAMRDPGLLFEALDQLTREGILSPDDCRVHWYVDNSSWKVIEAETAKAGVSSYMDLKGYVPASDIPKVLNSSSVLLLLTNKAAEDGPKGVMTTKFFESLAVEKPILCVRSDESYLAAAIQESHAGIAATSVEEVCSFLKQYYVEWKSKGYTQSSINRNVLHQYSRKEQAGQFVSIFNQLLS